MNVSSVLISASIYLPIILMREDTVWQSSGLSFWARFSPYVTLCVLLATLCHIVRKQACNIEVSAT